MRMCVRVLHGSMETEEESVRAAYLSISHSSDLPVQGGRGCVRRPCAPFSCFNLEPVD